MLLMAVRDLPTVNEDPAILTPDVNRLSFRYICIPTDSRIWSLHSSGSRRDMMHHLVVLKSQEPKY